MQAAAPKSIRALISTMKSKGHEIAQRPYELNLVGVRNPSTTPNKFDDKIYAFWKDELGNWVGRFYNATTDPGTYWLKSPMHTMGTAILKEGQYKQAYGIGNHRGYTALVQKKPVTVIRDYNRDDILDFQSGETMTGLYGINIHKAGTVGDTVNVDMWSAGCQVFQNPGALDEVLNLARKHQSLYGDITYTLIDERAYNRRLRRRGLAIALGVVLIGAAWSAYRSYKNQPIIPKSWKFKK